MQQQNIFIFGIICQSKPSIIVQIVLTFYLYYTQGLSGLVLSLLEYFVSTTSSMDLPVNAILVEGEYHNISSSLILLEEVLSQSNDTEQSEIISTIVAYPKFAKAAAILLEHVKDKGKDFLCYF